MNVSNMSTSRVAGADDMAVDEAGGVAPSPEWMEAAQKALENDGILETASAKRQKVRICICSRGFSPSPSLLCVRECKGLTALLVGGE